MTGNLFTLGKNIFGDVNTGGGGDAILNALQYLTTIAVDWRFAEPVDPTNPTGATFPYVYVGGAGGVFRSTNVLAQGQSPTWAFYPDASQGAAVVGGYLPDAVVSDLDLAIGDIDSTTGLYKQNSALNLLVATTLGRGQFAIRLDPNDLPIYSFQSGPRVVSVTNPTPAGPSTSTLTVTFNTLVDPNTFTPADVTLTGPNGPVTITGVTARPVGDATSATVFDISFVAQTAAGSYTLTVGPTISDPGGNLMNQNLTFPNGEAADAFVTQVILNSNVTTGLQVQNLPAQVGSGDASTVTVRLVDQNGNPVASTQSVFLAASGVSPNGQASVIRYGPGDPLAGQVVGPNTPVTINGSRTFTVQYFQAGGQTLTARSASTPAAINPVTANTSVVAVVAAALQWAAPPTTTVGVDVPFDLVLTAVDQFGNVATAYNGQVRLTSSDPNAVLADGTPLNGSLYTFAPGDAGRHTFTVRFRTLAAAGQTVTATTTSTSTPVITATSPAITVTPGPVATVAATANPTSVIPGGSTTVSVVLRDSFGNQVTNFSGTVTVTIGGVTGVVQPPSQAMPTGQGQFQVTLNSAGNATLTVTATPTTGSPVSSAPVPVTVSAPTAQASANPVTPSISGTTQVTVRVVDANGNLLTGYNGTVTLTSTDPAAVLPPATALTGGQVTVPVTLNTVGAQTITATVSGPGGPLTAPVQVTVNAPSIRVSANPTAILDGRATQVTVRAVDANGNLIPGYNGTVTLTSTDPAAVLPPATALSGGQIHPAGDAQHGRESDDYGHGLRPRRARCSATP